MRLAEKNRESGFVGLTFSDSFDSGWRKIVKNPSGGRMPPFYTPGCGVLSRREGSKCCARTFSRIRS